MAEPCAPKLASYGLIKELHACPAARPDIPCTVCTQPYSNIKAVAQFRNRQASHINFKMQVANQVSVIRANTL